MTFSKKSNLSSNNDSHHVEELTDAAVVSRSWHMGFATLISRITGFIRIVLLATILGGALASSFSVANQLPNQIAALVLEATFTAIFIPVLARAEKDDIDSGAAFIRRLITVSTIILVITTIVSLLGAPWLVELMLGNDSQVNKQLTVAFSYLLLPQIIGYGLSSVFMAILNTRNIFGLPAWAPVANNIIAIFSIIIYIFVPGELSPNLMNPKLLILGIGTTCGILMQTLVLMITLKYHRINFYPLWGIDTRLKQFGTTAIAMMLYVFISQIGLIITNQISSSASSSGPAIYYYCWLLLQFPFGMIGVTILTVVMPRLSRHAASNLPEEIRGDLSLAIRLMMLALIPIITIMTLCGKQISQLLFAYGNFGSFDAHYLGIALSLSSFTLIPYGILLLQLRVFYAQEKPWIPIILIIIITSIKVGISLILPHIISDNNLIAGYLGFANGIGFLGGSLIGWIFLHKMLCGKNQFLINYQTIRTSIILIFSALFASGIIQGTKIFLIKNSLQSTYPILYLIYVSLVVLIIIGTILLVTKVPDAQAGWNWVNKLTRKYILSNKDTVSSHPQVSLSSEQSLKTLRKHGE